MKKLFLHMVLLSVLGMLTVSCRDYDEELVAPDNSKAQVVFSVAMDTPMARTRAAEDWGDNYDPSDPGTAKDNRIDIDQLIVKIVDGNKEYKIVDIMKWKSGDNSYKFVGVVEGVDEAITLDNAKVYVYANMGKGTEPAETFTQDAEYIPMWGVKKVRLNFVPGKRADAGKISLLRAMAKLEVKLGGEMAGEYELTGATLNKYNKVGNTHPALPEDFDFNTESLGLETVLNVNTSAATELALAKTENGSSYIVYLPEVKNGTSEADWLKISVGLKEKNGDGTEEGSFFIKDYSNEDNPVAIDIIRNHWYQYTITGFAASEIQVEYNVLDWQGVNMEIGGDGFLFLNKDKIEIYNSNIDTDQLKFASSSPIKSIELKDIYMHGYDGTFTKGTEDGVSAYYITKYGQKIQLGTDPGFDIADKEVVLAREQVILNHISATAEANTLNGDITINSPFLAETTNEIPELQHDSHYDTPRYLEFLVTNQQGLTATFRVIQYPAVVITNEEGFFSYRDDFCEGHHELGTNKAPTHYLNFQETAYILAFLQNTEIHQVDPLLKDKYGHDYYTFSSCWPANGKHFKELLLADNGNGSWYKSSVYPYGEFKREYWGSDFGSGTKFVGPPYRDLEYVHPHPQTIDQTKLNEVKGTDRDGWWRKHYTGNMIEFFMSKVIKQVYRDGIDNNGYKDDKGNVIKRLPGQADIFHHMVNNTNDGWTLVPKLVNVNTMQFNNNRMYHIKTQHISDKYTIGYPEFVVNDSVLIENKTNANLVSPSFMVASQLGTTEMPVNDHPGVYEDASLELIYEMAKIHCKQYVEAKFDDTNGNGIPEPELGEKVTYYHNWRLPTKAEIDLIIDYQNSSRAMDVLLTGERYMCVTGDNDKPYSDQVEGYKNSGYFMRCVRDVKPNENK